MKVMAGKLRVNYPHLDLIKLAMALFVVEIHTRPLRDVAFAERIVEGVDVLAVPFFFIASAFLCFKGLSAADFATSDSRGSVRVRKTTGKLLRLYLTWTVLYLPVTVYGHFLKDESLLYGIASILRGTLLVGKNFCSGPLWYLLASVVAFALVYLCLRKGVTVRRLLIISAGFLLAGALLTVLRNWDGAPPFVALPVKAYFVVFGGVKNGLFKGFFYVAFGAAMGMNHERICKMPITYPVALLVIGVFGCIFIINDDNLPFCACASIALFLLSVRYNGNDLKPHVAARNASTIIYLVHMFFAVVFVYGICGGTSLSLLGNEVNTPLLYLFALGGSCVVSAIVIVLSNKLPVLKTVFGI